MIIRSMPTFGYCWVKCGWKYVGKTKAGQLAFQLLPDDMPPPEPCIGMQAQMFPVTSKGESDV